MERTTVTAWIDVALDPETAFDTLVDELGPVLELGKTIARERGRRILLEWRSADWARDETSEVEITFEAIERGTRVTVAHRGWGALLGDRGGEAVGWFAGEVASPLLRATAPARFAEWLTDRVARRPSGAQARETYRDPLFHRPNFGALLELLAVTPEDHLLEVGCGGGAFLRDALESGCHAAAIDHSPDMVRLAREVNASAVTEGRLEVVESDAGDPLPFPDEAFTAATMTGVLGFLPDAVATLVEIRRVLVPGGRLVLLGSDPAWRGTPAAPEPFASRIRFYTDEELAQLGRDAGFADVRVERIGLEPHAREAGVPEEYLPLFADAAPFLVARRP